MYVSVKGNLLQNPEQRWVPVANDQKLITEIRIMENVYRRIGDELVEDKEKSRPVNVTVWSENLGKRCMELLRTGMRVRVDGELTVHPWTDKEGKAQFDLQVSAEDVNLALNRVEGISMRQRSAAQQEPSPGDQAQQG